MRRAALAAAVLLATACANGDKDNTLAVTATGRVFGFVYFDADGSRSLTNADSALGGVKVRLYAAGDTVHPLQSVSSLTSGRYNFTAVPVGLYAVRVDTTTVPANQGVLKVDSASFSVLPGDSVEVDVAVGFPSVSIAAARALPAGRTVFLTGVVLNNYLLFSDSIVHLEDTSAAIRLTRLRDPVQTGDSVRVRGTTSVRDSFPALDDVHVFSQGTGLIPAALVLTPKTAATADSGKADARLALLRNVLVADTATTPNGYELLVVDSAGAADTLKVLLDPAVDQGFIPQNAPANDYIPGNKFTIAGLLEPAGSGTWLLKPRSASDLKKL